jgi:hypothetical protein
MKISMVDNQVVVAPGSGGKVESLGVTKQKRWQT